MDYWFSMNEKIEWFLCRKLFIKLISNNRRNESYITTFMTMLLRLVFNMR